MELDGNPRVIRKGIIFDKKSHVGMWLFLYKIRNAYYWFYEDDVDYGCRGMSSIKLSINNARKKAKSTGLSFNLVREEEYRKKENVRRI